MLRPFLTLLLVLAATASAAAQTAPDSTAAPVGPVIVAAGVPAPAAPAARRRSAGTPAGAQAGQALLTVAAHGVVVATLLAAAGDGEHGPAVPVLLLLSPAAAGGAACATGRAFGVPGSCGQALLWSFIGAAPGLAIMAAGTAANEGDLVAQIFAVVIGGILYVGIPPFAALEGYRGARFLPGLSFTPTPGGGATPVAALTVQF
ncbi:MAG TPA: hypothetical protein VK610_05925 [Rhodothermales bacterium]|nr:hypothetical protein [Rhodothermales bacterium]